MPDVPKKTEKVITRHSWTIGSESEPVDAKNFEYGIQSAKRGMADLGVDLSFDNAYYVTVGEGSEVILYVDIEADER